MIKNWFTTSKIEETHPTEEDLLKCVDGELSAKEAARVRAHLETCWSCRLNLEKIEETISAFVEFRQQIQLPLTQKPPKNWNDFDRNLNELATDTSIINKSWWSGNMGGFGKFFQNLIPVSNLSPIWKQTAISTIAVILIAVIFCIVVNNIGRCCNKVEVQCKIFFIHAIATCEGCIYSS